MKFNKTSLQNAAETPFHKLDADVQEQFRAAIKLGAQSQILNVENVWINENADLTGASAIVRIINWTPPEDKIKKVVVAKTGETIPSGALAISLRENSYSEDVDVMVTGKGVSSYPTYLMRLRIKEGKLEGWTYHGHRSPVIRAHNGDPGLNGQFVVLPASKA